MTSSYLHTRSYSGSENAVYFTVSILILAIFDYFPQQMHGQLMDLFPLHLLLVLAFVIATIMQKQINK